MLPHEHLKTLDVFTFQIQLLDWYTRSGRHTLPWQHPPLPYPIWISEIMCQQTQVATVIPYFKRFIQAFPTLEDLAISSEASVLSYWSGLGYYARARNLHRTAKILLTQFNGHFPEDLETLQTLPGIGRSTAGAIYTLAFNRPAPILDGNVKRVLARLIDLKSWPGLPENLKMLWTLSERLVPTQRVNEYTQAMMDLGALICRRTQPLCSACPIQSHCRAYAQAHTQICPVPRPKRIQPTRYSTWALIISPTHILLKQNPSKGLWGGLWCPPSIEAAMNCFAQHHVHLLKKTPPTVSNLRIVKHTFTHFKLYITPIVIDLSQHPDVTPHGLQWQPRHHLDHFAHPSPLAQLIQRINRSISCLF